ncbi:hypothetical protein KA082_02145 [Candidatus Woesebacteria bacterium]|nr:hypothetical protein [Candidatus Woesebacteria bacterium]
MNPQGQTLPAHPLFVTLQKKAATAQAAFAQQQPEVYDYLQRAVVTPQPKTEPAVPATTETQSFAQQLTSEEYSSILEKAHALTLLPAGSAGTDLEQYLEQQLGEILGFTITRELEGNTLLLTHGVLQALPHTKLSPNDTLTTHTIQRAGFSPKRSFYGWSLSQPGENQSEQHQASDHYSLSIPLFSHPDWMLQATALTTWYHLRKIVVINPIMKCAVVAAVTDICHFTNAKYHYGGSPELIMNSKVWAPQSMGRALFYFVEDQTIPLGYYNLNFLGET